MKRFVLSAIIAGAMVASAAAQTSGTSSSTPGGPGASGGATSYPDTTAQTGTDATAAGSNSKVNGGQSAKDKKVKMTGCISSQGSNYMLMDKKHPNGVQLMSSEDLSAHVGHKVEVKGTWASSNTSASNSSTGSTSTDSSMTAANPGQTSGAAGASTGAEASTSASSSGTSSGANAGATNSTSNPSGATSASGSYGSNSNASALPQSDMGSMNAIRVSEIKMKSDKCDMPTNNSNSPTK